MKAPDKIYIAESLIKTPYGNEWSPTPYISRENTEYIRKEALLEKIDDAIAHLSDGSLTGYYESLAYKDIRELIKSM